MKGEILTRGMWQIAYKATNVLCSDGKRRNVKITGQPDTFFSIPASVQVKGKTVTGFLYTQDDGELIFCQYLPGKNGHLLPDIPIGQYKEA